MKKAILMLAIAGTAVVAQPALADGGKSKTTRYASLGAAVYDDSNSHWLDYKTDLSEAKRELHKDLARANDEADRVDAWAEYRREVADARHDFAKEMAERGIIVRRGTAVVEDSSE